LVNGEKARYGNQILSGYSIRETVVIRAAIRVLDSLIMHTDFGIPELRQQLELPSSWVEGETLRPPS